MIHYELLRQMIHANKCELPCVAGEDEDEDG